MARDLRLDHQTHSPLDQRVKQSICSQAEFLESVMKQLVIIVDGRKNSKNQVEGDHTPPSNHTENEEVMMRNFADELAPAHVGRISFDPNRIGRTDDAWGIINGLVLIRTWNHPERFLHTGTLGDGNQVSRFVGSGNRPLNPGFFDAM